MSNNVPLLVKLLQRLEKESKLANNPNAVLSDQSHELVSRIIVKAKKEVLATQSPPQQVLDALHAHGYNVIPEETDLLGWLKGAIGTSKGRVVF